MARRSREGNYPRSSSGPDAVCKKEVCEGTREYIRILRLHERYTTDQIGSALHQAEELGCLGADEVEMLLFKRSERLTALHECSLNLDDALASLRVEPVNLQRFNELVEVCA